VQPSGHLSRDDLVWLIPEVDMRLPRILEEVHQRFRVEWPDYAEFLSREQDEVRAAAREFLRQLIDIVEQPDGDPARAHDTTPQTLLFEEIGRVQWREGRDLTTLLSAYQVGARVAWHHVSAVALEVGAPPDALAALAEAVFIFVDQLSSASARGYVYEQTESSAAREHLRDELVELLLSGRADEPSVRGAASRAGWPLPRQAAVILVDPDNEIGQRMLTRLDSSSSLLIRRRNVIGAIVADPVQPGRRARLAESLRHAGAVLGPPVDLEYLPASLHIAEVAATLKRDGVLTDDPVFAEDHLDAIIVHRDSRLLAAFQARMLAPLADLPAGVRDRLTETLASWLRHFGDRRAVAAELHVHPQTVRYRMAQLHERLGPVLDDADGRARLILALGWQRPSR
jgi:hypothetical protein